MVLSINDRTKVITVIGVLTWFSSHTIKMDIYAGKCNEGDINNKIESETNRIYNIILDHYRRFSSGHSSQSVLNIVLKELDGFIQEDISKLKSSEKLKCIISTVLKSKLNDLDVNSNYVNCVNHFNEAIELAVNSIVSYIKNNLFTSNILPDPLNIIDTLSKFQSDVLFRSTVNVFKDNYPHYSDREISEKISYLIGSSIGDVEDKYILDIEINDDNKEYYSTLVSIRSYMYKTIHVKVLEGLIEI